MCYESWYRKQEDTDAAEKVRKQTQKVADSKIAPTEPGRPERERQTPVMETDEVEA
jgi:hypothetical protein